MEQLLQDWIERMPERDWKFFKELGQRVAQLRKEQGLTQVQLAEMLSISQQLVAAYEVGRRRIPVSMLPALADVLAVSVEDLLGKNNKALKRGPTPKLQRQLERVSRLPRSKQRFVMEMLDTVLSKTG